MDPPSAIHGAMGRERKPFTYTPGGLDLSEIKSERMAKRLMRNAMNQGVPEYQTQPVQSPTASAPITVPNFNCLPVQVFPTFDLPANPKSLLRTRSIPDQYREPPSQRVPTTYQTMNSVKPSGKEQFHDAFNSNMQSYSQLNNNVYNNNNRPPSMYDLSLQPSNSKNLTRSINENNTNIEPLVPEMSYEAEYLHAQPRNNKITENAEVSPCTNNSIFRQLPPKENFESDTSDFTIKPTLEKSFDSSAAVTKPFEDNLGTIDDDDEQKQVRVVKKQVKKENKVENQNGDQNGDAEAEMTVKLPTKKSAAKTETKVEVVKKVLPDGSIEEIKTTTTKTTIDGKTEITTKTETSITPKEDEVEEIEEEEEEEKEVDENGEEEVNEEPVTVTVKKTTAQESPTVKENGKQESIVKKEERTETTTTKKVVVVQKSSKEEKETKEEKEEEVVEEVEPVEVIKPVDKQAQKEEPQEVEEEEEEEEEEELEEVSEERKQDKKPEHKVEKVEVKTQGAKEEEEEEEEEIEEVEVEKKDLNRKTAEVTKSEEDEEIEEEEEFEEAEEPEEKIEPKFEKKVEPVTENVVKKEDDEESEYTEEEVESEKEEIPKPAPIEVTQKTEIEKEESKPKENVEEKPEQPSSNASGVPEPKVPIREPSIPLDKVEDIDIKPIGPAHETVSKSRTESTEIITNASEKPAGTLSTQTEYNRIENIVTVNRTTKTLDHSYEQLTQQGIPTVKTYFAPDRERVETSPQPSRPYQPVYPSQPQPQQERRHSLLLERLSTERQMPSEIYQNNYQLNNQSYEQQRQWSQEPQSEIINVSNVKPSTITNQQWYQQTRKDNVIYNNVTPSTPAPSQQWIQPQPQSQIQTQQPPLQYQISYTENTSHDISRFNSNSNTYQQQNSYPSYTPKPTNWASNNLTSSIPSINTQPNQYPFLNKDSSETYQKTSQQYSSSYVPPPWEQDPSYVAPEIPAQNYYQSPSSANTVSPSSQPGWKPTPSLGKFSKPTPTSYVPPAPNQSFVKPVSVAEPPNLPGRKTYYSEYERRYITVPESTYIPSDTKFQPQPDPSPQYYYDNNEPSETVEHQWRKELREFTEKTSTQSQQQTEQSSIKPPWEEDSKYVKVPTVIYNPTPSWSQTLRPQSHYERSFESEYVNSNEWSKTSTLGRSRPLSSYENSKVETTIPERPRGVSVDRYNPNNYQAPITSEHGPVQTHTLNPNTTPHTRGYHNPSVPAYHARASAEPRDLPAPGQQARQWGESRASPIQSRSFKYLQWITGTEN